MKFRKTSRFLVAALAIIALLVMMTPMALAARSGSCIISIDNSTGTSIFSAINALPAPWNTIAWALFTVVILGAIALLVIFRRTPFVKRILFDLVCKAEDMYGSKTGQQKFNAVYIWLCAKFPLLAFFIPESLLNKWIEEAVEKMKAYLASTQYNIDPGSPADTTPMGGATDGDSWRVTNTGASGTAQEGE